MATVISKKSSPLVSLYLLPPIVKLLLAFGVMALTIVIGIFVLRFQSTQDVSSLESQRQSLEVEVAKEARNYGELSYLPKAIVDTKKEYQALLKQFPPGSKVGDLLAAITKLGTQEGLKFVYYRPEKGTTYEYYVGVPIDISVVGRFHQIGKFLDGLANLPGSVVAINEFSLDRDSKNESLTEGLLTFHFQATLYYVLPSAADIK